jgi:hypothetical protein
MVDTDDGHLVSSFSKFADATRKSAETGGPKAVPLE